MRGGGDGSRRRFRFSFCFVGLRGVCGTRAGVGTPSAVWEGRADWGSPPLTGGVPASRRSAAGGEGRQTPRPGALGLESPLLRPGSAVSVLAR